MKHGLILLAFVWLLFTSCQRNSCSSDSDCAYEKTSEGLPDSCVNARYGTKEFIPDHPACVCDEAAQRCILEPCENPPCYLG